MQDRKRSFELKTNNDLDDILIESEQKPDQKIIGNFKEYSAQREDDGKESIEDIINENDRLKENLKERNLKIETLNFRCEKLQSELTLKLNENNKLSLEVNDLREKNKQLT